METTTAKLIFQPLEATGPVPLTVVKVKIEISLQISFDPLKHIYQSYLLSKIFITNSL